MTFISFSAYAQVVNDACSNAIPVTCGSTVAGTTVGSTPDATPFCGTSNTSPGVWYRLTGTGTQITVNTCAAATFDTKLTVFTGTCSTLTCISGNDDFCGLRSQVTFSSVAGAQYYVLVHGFGSATGTFTLTTTCVNPITNDNCSNATPIGCNTTVTGTTVGATVDAAPFCGTSITAPGVWYRLTGTGQTVTVNTCTGTTYDSKISVYSGTCASLTCISGNDDFCGLQSQVTFPTTAGVQYYVLVHGFGSATGTFTLSTTCFTPPVNDQCQNAIPLGCGSVVTGTTSGASIDPAPFCSTSVTAPGVWYRIAGTGDRITVSSCGGTAYDNKISVYTGNCNAFSCVTGNDDFCGLQSQVTFCSTPGVQYFILVHGFGNATGNFTLNVTCTPTSPNDDVCNATVLVPGVPEPFDNTCATAQPGEVTPGAGTGPSSCDAQDGWCSSETAVQSSLWFTFQAPPSGCVSIDAGPGDFQLAVYSVVDCSNFGTFTELAANDDGGPGLSPHIEQLSCLVPGQTYYVQLDGFGSTRGAGTIIITDCGNAPLTVEAGDCQTILAGYGNNNCATITAAAAGGFPPYTYEWTDGNTVVGTTATVTVCPSTTTTYTVTVTDSHGCTATDVVTVYVVDVRCGNNNSKVQVCHVPPGNPGNSQTICVSPNAVPSHVGNHTGDRVGPCELPCQNIANAPSSARLADNGSAHSHGTVIQAYPNPATEEAVITFTSGEATHATVEVFNVTGVLVDVLFDGNVEEEETRSVVFKTAGLPAGIYTYRLTTGSGSWNNLIIVVK